MKDDSVLWQTRHFVYAHTAETTRPPSVDETAAHFRISIEEASELTKGDVRLRHNVDIKYARDFRLLNPTTSIALTIENTYLGQDEQGVDKIAYGVTVYVGERLIKADTKLPNDDVLLLSVW